MNLRDQRSHFIQRIRSVITGIIQWDLFWWDETVQTYGIFQGFPINIALFGLLIECPLYQSKIDYTVDGKRYPAETPVEVGS